MNNMKSLEINSDLGKIKNLLVEVKTSLSNLYKDKIKEIILYGSYSRNEERNESDIDIAIILSEEFEYLREIKKVVKATYDIGLKYNKHISIHPVYIKDLESSSSPFLENIQKEGIVL